MNVKNRFNPFVAIIIVCTIIFSVFGLVLQISLENTITKSRATNVQAIRTTVINDEVQNMINSTTVLENINRSFVATGDEALAEGMLDTMNSLRRELAHLQGNLRNEDQHRLFALLTTLVERKIQFATESISLFRTRGQTAAQQLLDTKRGMELRDSILIIARTINSDMHHDLSANLTQNSERAESALWLTRILTFIGIAGVIALSYMIIRRLRKQQGLIMLLKLAHHNEAAARRNVERVSAEVEDLYDNAPCGYHSLNKEGMYVAINQTELNWLGYTRDEVVGKLHITDVVEGVSREEFERLFSSFKEKGHIHDLRFKMISKTGRVFPVAINATAIYDADGNYLSSRSTVFDITTVVNSEAELKEAKRLADESAQIKEQFLANMSHEIRTPVNSIIGFTNLLQKTSLSGDQEQFVRLIQSASENLLSIINEILDLSKMEAGMLRIEKHPFSLRGLCGSVETMFRPRAEEKRLDFSISVQPDIPDTLNGDTIRLTQILVNLIANAIKFTLEGSINVSVTNLAQNDASVRLLFSVADTGIGIAPDKQEKIFERFEQGETDTTRKYGGTGLGLAIVKKLVEIQNGAIRVQSQQGVGTRFEVEMEYGLVTGLEGAPVNFEPEVEMLEPLRVEGKKVLIVEDNEMNQLLMNHTFKSWQIDFEMATNGQQAIDWLRREKFDLVLLDIQMPVLDGYATARAIRKDLKTDIPIIAMTAHAMPGEREKCIGHGMNDYISKPLHERELQQLLRKYLQSNGESILALKDQLEYVDMNFLWDLVMENTEFLQKILQQFMKQFPSEMDELKMHVAAGDTAKVATLAHHIKSTASVLGKTTPFFEQLENLEKLARHGASAFQVKIVFQSLIDHQQQLMAEMERLRRARF
jgi:PAS domain S-box-containing protein